MPCRERRSGENARRASPLRTALFKSGRGWRQDERGQLMMLAGIVLTISFILTSLTLAQVASLEKEASREAPSPIISEWRFLHERLASNVRTAITPETTNQSFVDTIIPTLSATFRALAAEKGYDIVLRPAGDGRFAANGNEASLLNGAGTNYDAWTYSGSLHYTHLAEPSTTDGIIWQSPCPDTSGPAAGCIGGVLMFIRLADASTSMEESVLFDANQG